MMADIQAIFEQHVRGRLESSFGSAVAMMIVASASVAANVSTMVIGKEEYHRLCEAIARDQRVIDMWGASGANDALQGWRQLGT